MLNRIVIFALIMLFGGSALARDVGTNWNGGRNRGAVTQRPQNGGWTHHHQPGGKWRGHDHFSPRGQGGHHWGW